MWAACRRPSFRPIRSCQRASDGAYRRSWSYRSREATCSMPTSSSVPRARVRSSDAATSQKPRGASESRAASAGTLPCVRDRVVRPGSAGHRARRQGRVPVQVRGLRGVARARAAAGGAVRDRHDGRGRGRLGARAHAPGPLDRRTSRGRAHGARGRIAPWPERALHRAWRARSAPRDPRRAAARSADGHGNGPRGGRGDQLRHDREPRRLRSFARLGRAGRPSHQLAHAGRRAPRGLEGGLVRLPALIQRSLRHKVMLLVLAITFSALALSAAGLVIYDLRSYERQSSADLLSQAEVLARAAAPALSFSDPKAAAKDLSVMQVRPGVVAAALYSRDGRLFATYSRPGAAVPPFPVAPGAEGHAIDGDTVALFRPVLENNERVGTVYLRGVYQPWNRLKDYLAILFLVMIASLAVAALLSGWLQDAITAPILEVARVSHDVMENRDYSVRARKSTQDEIGELVDAFNAMLAEIGRRAEALRMADQRKDEFLATLAHELRNPLAPIRNALEILRLAGDDPVQAAQARAMMRRPVGRR